MTPHPHPHPPPPHHLLSTAQWRQGYCVHTKMGPSSVSLWWTHGPNSKANKSLRLCLPLVCTRMQRGEMSSCVTHIDASCYKCKRQATNINESVRDTKMLLRLFHPPVCVTKSWRHTCQGVTHVKASHMSRRRTCQGVTHVKASHMSRRRTCEWVMSLLDEVIVARR